MSEHDNVVADIVSNLGVEMPIPSDFLATDVIVLVRGWDEDGDEGLYEAHSQNLSWIVRTGMLNAALNNENVDTDWSPDDD